jgi:hypothetical protein
MKLIRKMKLNFRRFLTLTTLPIIALLISTVSQAGEEIESSELNHFFSALSFFSDFDGTSASDLKDFCATTPISTEELTGELESQLEDLALKGDQAITVAVLTPLENSTACSSSSAAHSSENQEILDSNDSTTRDKILSSISPSTKAVISAKGATFVSALLTYPMDLLKIRKQSNTIQVGQLYKGFLPFVSAYCPQVMMNLALYDHIRSLRADPFISGVASGYISGILSNPLWVYRVHQSLADKNDAPYNVRTYVKELKSDWRLGFRGQAINLPHSIGNGIFFLGFDRMNQGFKTFLRDQGCDAQLGNTEAIAGGSARVLANTITYPLDTIRIIRQKTGMTYLEIYKNLAAEGAALSQAQVSGGCVRPFYRGFGWASGRMAAGAGIYMHLYSKFKDALGYFKPDCKS